MDAHAARTTGLSHPDAQACRAGVPSPKPHRGLCGSTSGRPRPPLGRGPLAVVSVPTCPSWPWQVEDQQPSHGAPRAGLLHRAAGSHPLATASSLSAGLTDESWPKSWPGTSPDGWVRRGAILRRLCPQRCGEPALTSDFPSLPPLPPPSPDPCRAAQAQSSRRGKGRGRHAGKGSCPLLQGWHALQRHYRNSLEGQPRALPGMTAGGTSGE